MLLDSVGLLFDGALSVVHVDNHFKQVHLRLQSENINIIIVDVHTIKKATKQKKNENKVTMKKKNAEDKERYRKRTIKRNNNIEI